MVKQKQKILCRSLEDLPQNLFDDQIKEFERIARLSLVVNMPHQFDEIQNLYASEFLKKVERVKDISTMAVKNAMLLLEEEYSLSWKVTLIRSTV